MKARHSQRSLIQKKLVQNLREKHEQFQLWAELLLQPRNQCYPSGPPPKSKSATPSRFEGKSDTSKPLMASPRTQKPSIVKTTPLSSLAGKERNKPEPILIPPHSEQETQEVSSQIEGHAPTMIPKFPGSKRKETEDPPQEESKWSRKEKKEKKEKTDKKGRKGNRHGQIHLHRSDLDHHHLSGKGDECHLRLKLPPPSRPHPSASTGKSSGQSATQESSAEQSPTESDHRRDQCPE